MSLMGIEHILTLTACVGLRLRSRGLTSRGLSGGPGAGNLTQLLYSIFCVSLPMTACIVKRVVERLRLSGGRVPPPQESGFTLTLCLFLGSGLSLPSPIVVKYHQGFVSSGKPSRAEAEMVGMLLLSLLPTHSSATFPIQPFLSWHRPQRAGPAHIKQKSRKCPHRLAYRPI